MNTTRNAETPPNFAPKTSQKLPEKLPNVASETLEKNIFFAAFGVAFLSLWKAFNLATLQRATALPPITKGMAFWHMHNSKDSKAPPNFVPKTS